MTPLSRCAASLEGDAPRWPGKAGSTRALATAVCPFNSLRGVRQAKAVFDFFDH